jgi:hypothetical protein
MLAQVTTKRAFLACAELIGSARGERNLHYVLFIGCTYAWTRHTLLETRTLPSVSGFAECFLSEHSAKQYFAERRTRQNIALGKAGFAECLALGKAWHSANPALGKRWLAVTVATCRQILPSV